GPAHRGLLPRAGPVAALLRPQPGRAPGDPRLRRHRGALGDPHLGPRRDLPRRAAAPGDRGVAARPRLEARARDAARHPAARGGGAALPLAVAARVPARPRARRERQLHAAGVDPGRARDPGVRPGGEAPAPLRAREPRALRRAPLDGAELLVLLPGDGAVLR